MHKERAIVIEFVGPPGSGKTTNCDAFVKQLTAVGVDAYVFKDVKTYLYQLGMINKVNLLVKTILKHGVDILRFKMLLLRHGALNFDSLFRYAKLCLFNQALQKFRKTKPGSIILLDQWIIQGIWSATIFSVSNTEKIIDRLKRFYFPVDYIVYFDLDIEIAIQRVGIRSTKTSRFDTMIEVKRMEVMRKHNHYLMSLFQLAKSQHTWLVSTAVSPEQNAIDFIVQLRKLKVIN